ncbi:MAG: efflux RND transporter periplasmic adaptor subunit [Gemmatimonadaceae bacterium]|nr:efflux RND transporter periplasmic adaptor subunit [Gemmatimonadaceae bacterium]
MKLPQPRRTAFLALLVVLAVPALWYVTRDGDAEAAEITTAVKKGDFRVVVTNAGELRAVRFVQVQGPPNAQQAESFQMKIASIVPEGTVVKAGDLVAELDRSSIAAKRGEVQLALTKAEAQLEQAQLDSTLNLSKAREDMKSMELALEERRIAREQAQFEAPSVRRQEEIAYEKAERALAQAKVDYKTKTEQAQAKMREVGADVQRQRNKLTVVDEVMAAFTIRAPADGMVIYVKEWNGRKKTAGSQVSPWDPTVATLPDLSQMETITYVNEIDVRKISVGHPAVITLDADPSKRLTGKVTSVANVGEQRPNADAKVFEVRVLLEQADTTLRPGMTSAAAIETYAIKEALYVPLEAVMADGDIPYVYRKRGAGVQRLEVETGAMNDDAVIIRRGLSEGDEILLSPPAVTEGVETVRLPGSGDRPREGAGDTARGQRPLPVPPASPVPAAKEKATATRTSR